MYIGEKRLILSERLGHQALCGGWIIMSLSVWELKPELICDGIRMWGAGKVIRLRWGHKSAVHMMRSVPSKKGHQRAPVLPLHKHASRIGHVNPQREGSPLQAWERLSADTQTPDLSLQSCEKHLLLLSLGLWYSVQQPKWTKRGLYSEKRHTGGTHMLTFISWCWGAFCATGGFWGMPLWSASAGSRTEWICTASKAPLSSYRSPGQG